MSTCEKIVPKDFPFVRTSTCMHGKTHVLLYLFAKNMACTREQIHLGLLLDLSAKDTAIELMYINMHVQGNSRTFGTA